MKYDFAIAWTSVITKPYYIPMAILWNEIVTIGLRQRHNQYWATVITVSYIYTHPVPNTLIITTFHQCPKQYSSIQTSHIFNNDNVLLPFIKIYRNRPSKICALILPHKSFYIALYRFFTNICTHHRSSSGTHHSTKNHVCAVPSVPARGSRDFRIKYNLQA